MSISAIRKELSRRATGLSDELRSKMKEAEKTIEEHKSDQKAINAGNIALIPLFWLLRFFLQFLLPKASYVTNIWQRGWWMNQCSEMSLKFLWFIQEFNLDILGEINKNIHGFSWFIVVPIPYGKMLCWFLSQFLYRNSQIIIPNSHFKMLWIFTHRFLLFGEINILLKLMMPNFTHRWFRLLHCLPSFSNFIEISTFATVKL